MLPLHTPNINICRPLHSSDPSYFLFFTRMPHLGSEYRGDLREVRTTKKKSTTDITIHIFESILLITNLGISAQYRTYEIHTHEHKKNSSPLRHCCLRSTSKAIFSKDVTFMVQMIFASAKWKFFDEGRRVGHSQAQSVSRADAT